MNRVSNFTHFYSPDGKLSSVTGNVAFPQDFLPGSILKTVAKLHFSLSVVRHAGSTGSGNFAKLTSFG
jgi:hypothetical protein